MTPGILQKRYACAPSECTKIFLPFTYALAMCFRSALVMGPGLTAEPLPLPLCLLDVRCLHFHFCEDQCSPITSPEQAAILEPGDLLTLTLALASYFIDLALAPRPAIAQLNCVLLFLNISNQSLPPSSRH